MNVQNKLHININNCELEHWDKVIKIIKTNWKYELQLITHKINTTCLKVIILYNFILKILQFMIFTFLYL